ncbi:DNA mismatch endonuclease Vsr [Cereibacter sphaeroides]|uniref:Very short patch repair endonuclease n=1 Tax=Cereibacter sphaeroides TaxID=1063 RepID=A0AAX1ULL4_CERSP|nr:very short patch repair endonuclease [Cereibacter sphaeroides]RHZ95253.1 DNA mismatch endonuclease Vsr [Cereibacter sphaeroides]
MADTRSPEQRRQIMRAVGTKNTGPELIVRSLLHAKGYRYRLHPRSLPGRPDIVFPARHKAIFVNGCFWHGHDCPKGRLPTSRLDYWGPKIETNVARDRRKLSELEAIGWQTLVVWQCELKDIERVGSRLCAFLGPTKTDRQA